MVVVNLYRMTAITPAVIPPNNAWAGDGEDLGSTERDPIAFKLSKASSFNVFWAPEDLILNSLARLALRRIERKRKTVIAPVRRTLVETWRGVGSSLVAKMEGMSGESSTGPSCGGEKVGGESRG